MKLSDIKNRKVFEGLKLVNEVIRPVAEKWVDGKIHETDNLQLTVKVIGKKPLTDVTAYLYYYDEEGRELGHEFDITDSKILPHDEARLSFILLPPEGYSYSNIEIKAEYEEKDNLVARISIVIIFLALLYVYKLINGT